MYLTVRMIKSLLTWDRAGKILRSFWEIDGDRDAMFMVNIHHG